MKKTLVMLSVLAMIFSFAGIAAAADLCLDCGPKACPADNILCCPESADQKGHATYFDWETHWGYCDWYDKWMEKLPVEPTETKTNWAPALQPKCKLIFDLCECGENPDETFASGNTIGIRMTIISGGAYWTNDSIKVYVDTNSADLCKCGALVCDACGEDVFTPSNDGCAEAAFGFAGAALTYSDAAGKPVTPTELCGYGSSYDAFVKSCEVDCNAYAKVVQTSSLNGVLITEEFLSPAGPWNYWWVDIPAMVLDNSESIKGESITVKVELMSAGGPGICPSCRSVCECDVTVATACCEPADQTCIYFPYVTTDDTYGWRTGIAITNFGGAASLDYTLTLVDNDGDTFVWAVTKTDAVWAFFMDEQLGNFVGTGSMGPIGMLKVKSSEGWIDGFSFMTDGDFGGTTLARSCDCTLCDTCD